MHTSRTDLSRRPIEADGPFGSGVARNPAGLAEAALITRPRLDQASAAKPAGRKFADPKPTAGRGLQMPQSGPERMRDIAFSLALIIFLLPVLLLLMMLVTLCDPGPPIFAHLRVGKDGRRFKCYKLRSMYRDAEERLVDLLETNPVMRREWEASYKITNDPRVTPLGNFLRRSSLDELPQLFNVLNGSMTLVGPRPVVADELPRYGRHAACYLQVKPGLTGLWQVTGRCEVSYRRRIATDRLYVRRKSLMLDFKILLATVPAVLARKGAW